MQTQDDVTQDLTRQLELRGIRRVPGRTLAFARNGRSIGVEVLQSVYRGHVIALGDRRYGKVQFRARGGAYDWNAIAAAIEEATAPAAARTAQSATDELAVNCGGGAPTPSPISIKPSPKPGHVRVRVSEIDLDPVSMMQLYAAVRHALPRDEAPAFAW